jgi:hypothetical protein
MYFGQTGFTMVSFRDHTDFSGPPEPAATSFAFPPMGDYVSLLYQEDEDFDHYVTAISTSKSLLVDSVSTLNTVGDSSLLQDYT